MLSKKVHTSAFVLAIVFTLASTIWAQSSAVANLAPATHTLTITLKGTIGPILSGSDPLGINGTNGTVTIRASESLSPTKHTSTSATYTLPAGAIKVVAGTNHFSTTHPSKMIINLTSSADTLTLVVAGPEGLQVTDTTFLQAGSWTNGVLKHPAVFKPSPQTLTAAKTAGGPGCKIKYIIEGSTTVLGFAGTGSSKSSVDPLLLDEDLDQ
jgi:hypothetical protein